MARGMDQATRFSYSFPPVLMYRSFETARVSAGAWSHVKSARASMSPVQNLLDETELASLKDELETIVLIDLKILRTVVVCQKECREKCISSC